MNRVKRMLGMLVLGFAILTTVSSCKQKQDDPVQQSVTIVNQCATATITGIDWSPAGPESRGLPIAAGGGNYLYSFTSVQQTATISLSDGRVLQRTLNGASGVLYVSDSD